MLIRAYEAANYSQWLATNFFAVPALMFVVTMVTMSCCYVALVLVLNSWRRPTVQARLALLILLDAVASWGAVQALGAAAVKHLWSVVNVPIILAPSVFVVLLCIGLYKRSVPTVSQS